jgi:hypothetical protein
MTQISSSIELNNPAFPNPASIFTDIASKVKLEFWKTENHNLIDDQVNKNGVYTFTMLATLHNYPLMDEFTQIKSPPFTLTVTDVCTDEIITSPTINDMSF